MREGPADVTSPAHGNRTLDWDKLVVRTFLALWLAVLVVPVVMMLAFSFFTTEGMQTVFRPTLETWKTLFSSGRWFVGVRTLGFAFMVTAVALAAAVPFAFWLSKRCSSVALRSAILVAMTIPFFLEITSRTIVWRFLLGSSGPINRGLEAIGMPAQAWLLYSEPAVLFGMVILYFPSMFFPIYMAIELLETSLLNAAEDLGATPWQVFRLVVIPLAMPGILAGIVFTMVPAMAEFVVPQLLGGFNVNMLGNSINAALAALKYPTAAALSAFVLLALVVLAVMLRVSAKRSRVLASATEGLQT